MNTPQPFERPEITPVEHQEAERLARVIVFTQANRYIKLQMIMELITENMRCLKEINDHRTARGFELLPIGKAKGV